MRLLLLAGTGEARRIAAVLAAEGRDVVASLAGGTRNPAALDVPTRVGGFGGAEGFRQYLRAEGIGAVLDATHPFAAAMSMRTAAVCRDIAMPYVQVLRPEWHPVPGDDWHVAKDEAAAARLIPRGAIVFLATGPQHLDRFAGIDARVICRRIDPPDQAFPFPNGAWCVGRPPFSVADEVALFQRLGVDWLVTKNAGGEGARAKLDAARELGLPVVVIARPPQPEAERVQTIEQAVAWARARWSDA